MEKNDPSSSQPWVQDARVSSGSSAPGTGTANGSGDLEIRCESPAGGTRILPAGHPAISSGLVPPSHYFAWLTILHEGLGHRPYLLTARERGRLVGCMPLAFVRSPFFGRFLVSLPYLNSGGVIAGKATVGTALIDEAIQLADRLDVRFLELRHERPMVHEALAEQRATKLHMRLSLPASTDELWEGLKSKVRNQVRKAQKGDFTLHWGHRELIEDFYDVFSRNMRDLGTPVFGKGLFLSILKHMPDQAEICVVRAAGKPVAAALLVHGIGITEVPSASSLRSFNSTNPNMLLYWHLLERAVQRGQAVFDFGRSTAESNTFRFKKQWGAAASPAVWQYYVRHGTAGDMRPERKRYQALIRTWRRLPVGLTRLLGPPIVRGIP